MGKSGGGSSFQPTQTINNPPNWEMPDIRAALSQLMGVTMPGGQLAQDNMPNQQVAGFNPYEDTGLTNEFDTAQGQQGGVNAGENLTQQTLEGDYLNPSSNPYLQATSQAMAAPTIAEYQNAIAPSQMGQAALSGAFGGSADAENQALGQFNLQNTLGNMNEMLYGQNYQNERTNQLNTLNNLGNIESGEQAPSQAELAAGGMQQQQSQNQLNTTYQNQLNQAQWPYQLLQYLSGELGGLGQGAGRSTSTYPDTYAAANA